MKTAAFGKRSLRPSREMLGQVALSTIERTAEVSLAYLALERQNPPSPLHRPNPPRSLGGIEDITQIENHSISH